MSASVNATQSQIASRNLGAASRTASGNLAQKLSAAGLRLTRQRKTLLKILEETDAHLDAASLLEKARQHTNIDRATVYRTLEILKKNSLVDELDLMHLQGEMHYFEARSSREHFHLACFGCGEIREVEHPLFSALKQEIAKQEGFQIETARLEVGGYCSACQAGKSHRKTANESL